jgi:hypothetical protein
VRPRVAAQLTRGRQPAGFTRPRHHLRLPVPQLEPARPDESLAGSEGTVPRPAQQTTSEW